MTEVLWIALLALVPILVVVVLWPRKEGPYLPVVRQEEHARLAAADGPWVAMRLAFLAASFRALDRQAFFAAIAFREFGEAWQALRKEPE